MREVHTNYGNKHAPNKLLMRPEAKTRYIVGPSQLQLDHGISFKHWFETDHSGHTQKAVAFDLERLPSALYGHRYGATGPSTPGFDRGHLIASMFGAGMEDINLIPMPAAVNRGFSETTTRRRGFSRLADQKSSHEQRLSGSGEFYLTNYRTFEREASTFISTLPSKVTLEVDVTGYESTRFQRYMVPIVYVKVWIEDKPVRRWKIENDLTDA